MSKTQGQNSDKPKDRFTQKEIENIVGFFDALQRVHHRLMQEGYTIKDGKLIPPKKRST